RAVRADEIAPTLQQALDNWDNTAPRLNTLSERLDKGDCESAFELDLSALAAPLPRAFQFVDGSAYLPHVERVRKARGAEVPESFFTDPLMYQAVSDGFMGPYDPIAMADTAWGIDFESEIGVICDDIPMGASPGECADHIQLITILNDVSLRNLIPGELAKGFGFLQSKPRSSLAPVVVTPDELGDAWRENKLHRPLVTHYNGKLFGEPEAGEDMQFDFAELLAHAAKSRPLAAGTLLGSGTIANQDTRRGASCLAEKRMLEIIANGKPETPFMQFGDRVRIEMTDPDGNSYFGAIEQEVVES
ncbi:MAG: fumarylacetoacetate hydrolase family protein, partial [Wenzhouxiangellaceae bacterium]